jgi:outer membrane lipoprotein-sorting protein
MRNSCLGVLSLLWLLSAVGVSTASAQTADELVARYLKARGGLERIRSVNSIRMKGSMVLPAMEVPITMMMKRPDSVRMEFTVQGSTGVRAFDGKTGWSLMPFLGTPGPVVITGAELNELRNQADIDGALVDYKAKGSTLALVGKEQVNGAAAFKLKLTRSDGNIEWIYLDVTSYLDIKEEGTHTIQGVQHDVETFISDYRDVDGLKYPYAVRSGVKGDANQQQSLTIDQVELNVPLAAQLFHMPGGAPAGK